MFKKLLPIILIVYSFSAISQNIKISGNTKDTASKSSLPNALLMAVKFTDSTLVNFTRTNNDGIFKPITLPLDTYIVIISHPSFNDRTYLLVPNKNDSDFKFKNVILPPKSVQLNEVEIIAHKDKMYYKGDTLMFTADSFKTRPNATVEDLLRKLPGVRVDAAGKITVQGKAVDQVLVDGDEFFGTDPTVATRNLNANTIETVQVFDKKKEGAEGEGDETVKVVNLKLKEDAKKGYFGKISGASDFQKFYENDLLVNKFKKDLKVSVFALYTNTPKQAFDWNDKYKYGINENGEYDPETNSWTSYGDNSSGIPKTLKTGFYFNDKFGKSTKVNSNYTFKQNQLVSGSEVNTQFFLTDTSYTNKQVSSNTKDNLNHNFNLAITTKLDSLTEFIIKPKVDYTLLKSYNSQNDLFISQKGDSTRETRIINKGNSETMDGGVNFKLNRSFKKKDRLLSFTYNPTYYQKTSDNDLNTEFKYYQNQSKDSSLLQKRNQLNLKQEQNASISYLEPFTKKIKGEISYGFNHSLNNNNRKTLDFNGKGYDNINTAQSNDFRNTRMSNRAGARISYEVKKYRLNLGMNYKNIYQENVNLTKDTTLLQTTNSVLPYASANFRFNQSSNLSISYTSRITPADLQKMQPVIDNSDPNRISIGNPNLKPAFSNDVNLNYYFYKAISDVNMYTGMYMSQQFNDINEKTTFDSLGRSISMPVNINGNYNGNMWLGGGFPVFNHWLKINYSFNSSLSKNLSFVNEDLNTTNTFGVNPGLTLEKELEWMQLSVNGGYNYDITKQTISINSNQNYYSYDLGANLYLKLPKKFIITGEFKYTNNGNRTPGYNIEVNTLNATVSKSFFKRDALTVVLEGYDIFNQNINNQRSVQANTIVDTKTQIIKRYFLFRLIFKFTSQKTAEEEDEDDY